MNIGNVQMANNNSALSQSVSMDGDKTGQFASLISKLLQGTTSTNDLVSSLLTPDNGIADLSLVDTLDGLVPMDLISGFANMSKNGGVDASKMLSTDTAALEALMTKLLNNEITVEDALTTLFSAVPGIVPSVQNNIKDLFESKDPAMQKQLMQVLTALAKDDKKSYTNNELSTVMAMAGIMLNQDYSVADIVKTLSGLNSSQVLQLSHVMGVAEPITQDNGSQQTNQSTNSQAQNTQTTTNNTASSKPNLFDFVSDMKQAGSDIKAILAQIKAEVSVTDTTTVNGNPQRTEMLRDIFAYKTGTNLNASRLNTVSTSELESITTQTQANANTAVNQTNFTVPETGFTSEQSFSAATQVNTKMLEFMTAERNNLQQDGVKTLTMQLDPENLGKVTVKMIIEAGRMNVNIFTESLAAQKMLETRLGYLQDGIRTNIVPVDNVSVVHSPEEAMAFSNGFYRNSEQSGNGQQQYPNQGSQSNSQQQSDIPIVQEQKQPVEGYYV